MIDKAKEYAAAVVRALSAVQRNTNSVIRLNGEIVPLRPRE